jgi:pimeloyl-ACP methyl ester carboxylesterase
MVASPVSAPVAPAGAAWGEAATWRWRGLEVHWRRLGNPADPALVLVHGFGAASGHWRHNAGPLAQAGWCVYALDLVGFGASSQPNLRLDNRLWARQVAAFLEQVVGAPAVLVGNSLGALVALSCGVWAPAWVRAVVLAPLADPTLVMPVPKRRPPWRRSLLRWLVTWACRLLPLELLIPLIARTPLLDGALAAAYPSGRGLGPELRRLVARPALRPQAARALRAMSIAMALRPRGATAPLLLNQLDQPLLVIWGSRDTLVPPSVRHELQRHRPDLDLVLLEGDGHCPHDEDPERFNRYLLDWLGQLPGPTLRTDA